ncbi:hypothetical protein ACX801_07900 [Arthrobacter bambusae]
MEVLDNVPSLEAAARILSEAPENMPLRAQRSLLAYCGQLHALTASAWSASASWGEPGEWFGIFTPAEVVAIFQEDIGVEDAAILRGRGIPAERIIAMGQTALAPGSPDPFPRIDPMASEANRDRLGRLSRAYVVPNVDSSLRAALRAEARSPSSDHHIFAQAQDWVAHEDFGEEDDDFAAADEASKEFAVAEDWAAHYEDSAEKDEWVEYEGFAEADGLAAYEVFALTSYDNALALLSNDDSRTRQSALSFLRKNQLLRLIEDNSAHVSAMVRTGIPVDRFVEFALRFPCQEGTPPQRYADAAELFVLPEEDGEQDDKGYDYAAAVLEERVRAKDIKRLGGHRRIDKMDPARRTALLRCLESMGAGKVNYTAKELAHYMETGPVLYLDLLAEAGYEFLLKVRNRNWISGFLNHCSQLPVEQQERAVLYWDQLVSLKADHPFSFGHVVQLAQAGVPPAEVLDLAMTAPELSVEQVMAIKVDGIPQSIIDGWL